MEIRVIVPIQWNSDFRVELLKTLKAKGYTWRCGEDLESNQPNCVNAKYIAISATKPTVSYSSHMEIVNKVESNCGLNYLLYKPTIERALQTIKLIQKYWIPTLDEYAIVKLLNEHYSLLQRVL